MKTPIRLVLLSAAVLAAACGPSKQPDEKAPEFEGGGQEQNIGDPVYPGPYGIGIGSVIPNYQFQGYPRASLSMKTQEMVQMSDFYNPTGTEVYPEGSPYGAGTPKPLALIIDRSAVWCPPCQQEAATEIPKHRARTAPQGEFLVVLDETSVRGEPSTSADIEYWARYYNLNYPGVVDPAQRLDAIVGVAAYPGNVIVRTRDMKIVKWVAGLPGDSDAFWDVFQDVIDGKPVLPGDE